MEDDVAARAWVLETADDMWAEKQLVPKVKESAGVVLAVADLELLHRTAPPARMGLGPRPRLASSDCSFLCDDAGSAFATLGPLSCRGPTLPAGINGGQTGMFRSTPRS